MILPHYYYRMCTSFQCQWPLLETPNTQSSPFTVECAGTNEVPDLSWSIGFIPEHLYKQPQVAGQPPSLCRNGTYLEDA